MRSINTIFTSSIAVCTLFLSGCVVHQPATQPQEGDVQSLHIPIETQSQILTELFELLEPKFVLAQKPIQIQSTSPQLIAGDWLAWQCAIVGGYWDMPQINAPAYAEAFESIPLN